MVEPRKVPVDGIALFNLKLQEERHRRQSERQISKSEDDRCSQPERTQCTLTSRNQARELGSEGCAAQRRRVRSPFLNCACLCRAVIADRLKALNQATAELEKKNAKAKKSKKAVKGKGKKGARRGSKSSRDSEADIEQSEQDTESACNKQQDSNNCPLLEDFHFNCHQSSSQTFNGSKAKEGFQSKLPILTAYRISVAQNPQQRRISKESESGSMCEKFLSARKNCCPPCPLPCPPPCPPPIPPPAPRVLNKRKSFDDTPGKKMKNINNQQKRTDTSYTCTCTTCNNKLSCCCAEDLEAIEEEHDPCEDLCSPYMETTVQGRRPSTQSEPSCCPKKPAEKCDAKKDATAVGGEEDDPCGEFFDIMRETMEDAVKKTLDCVFSLHFSNLLDKMEGLCCQMERSECIISKIYADLNDKIAYYGERNAQQFQYLCVRMEHDRLFYQQQQEYFLKAIAKCPQSLDLCSPSQSQQDESEPQTMRCSMQKSPQKCGNDEKHSKGKIWECTLQMPDDMRSTGSKDEDDKVSEKSSTRRSKTRESINTARGRSESTGTNDGKGGPKSPKKK